MSNLLRWVWELNGQGHFSLELMIFRSSFSPAYHMENSTTIASKQASKQQQQQQWSDMFMSLIFPASPRHFNASPLALRVP